MKLHNSLEGASHIIELFEGEQFRWPRNPF
jgi:hypothetical protein